MARGTIGIVADSSIAAKTHVKTVKGKFFPTEELTEGVMVFV